MILSKKLQIKINQLYNQGNSYYKIFNRLTKRQKNIIENIIDKDKRYRTRENLLWVVINKFDMSTYTCKTCGKPLSIFHYSKLYQFCSVKCLANSQQVIAKRRLTISKDKNFYNNRLQKNKISFYIKYKDLDINNYSNNNQKRQLLKKRGFYSLYKENTLSQKIKEWNIINSFQNVSPNFSFIQYNIKNKMSWKCNICGSIFDSKIEYSTLNDFFSSIPEHCHLYSEQIKSFYQFIDSLKEHYIKNQIIEFQEFTYIFRDKRLAIYFDNIFDYNLNTKLRSKHRTHKFNQCIRNNYKFLNIKISEWITKKDIIKQKIKYYLNINQIIIYARICTIHLISSKEKNIFLEKTHIQGKDKSKIKLGLFYQNKLVGLMTFSIPRFNKHFQWQLIRYSTKRGIRLIGGAGKLLSYFQKNYNPTNIITYANKSYSTGNLYYKLGFQKYKESISYFWIREDHILTRYKCQKHLLKNILGDRFDQNLSQRNNMINNGYIKIYDPGTISFIKTYNKSKN